MVARQKEARDQLVQAAGVCFQGEQAASARRDWCNHVPKERKVEAVQSFIRWRHDRQNRLLWVRGDPGKGLTYPVACSRALGSTM